MKYIHKRMPEQPRVDYNNLTETGKPNIYTGGVYLNYNGKPFTGFAIEADYSTGERIIIWEQQYVNGEDIGWEISYHDNEMVDSESLSIGATNVYFVNNDEEGNCLGDHFFSPDLLDELCEIIGEDPANAKPLDLKE
ncbi:MAG: hypothetical protein ACPGSD_03960 [Flavobacteriales bacterium]